MSGKFLMTPPTTKIDCNRDWCGVAGWVCGKCCDIHCREYEKYLSEFIIPPPKKFANVKDVGTQT